MKKFNTKDRGALKSTGPVAIVTFATIVNPALLISLWSYYWKQLCPTLHCCVRSLVTL